MSTEIWRNINDIQSISNRGNVKYGDILIESIPISKANLPYIHVNDINVSIQSLVVEYFMNIDTPDAYIIRHVDGNTLNNDIDNLSIEFITEYNEGDIEEKDNPEELMEGEELRIVGLENIENVGVTNFGRIYNCSSGKFNYGPDNGSSISIHTKLSTRTPIAKLVYYTFNPDEVDDYNNYYIQHLDGEYSNNKLENLKKATMQEINTIKKKYKNSKDIYQYDSKTGDLLNKWSCINHAVKSKVATEATIKSQLNFSKWADSMNYIWMYELVNRNQFNELVIINMDEFVFVYYSREVRLVDGYINIGFKPYLFNRMLERRGLCFEHRGILYSKDFNMLIERIQ